MFREQEKIAATFVCDLLAKGRKVSQGGYINRRIEGTIAQRKDTK